MYMIRWGLITLLVTVPAVSGGQEKTAHQERHNIFKDGLSFTPGEHRSIEFRLKADTESPSGEYPGEERDGIGEVRLHIRFPF